MKSWLIIFTMAELWLKRKTHGGPDSWTYKNNRLHPAIAILKQKSRIIAKFWGPVNISDGKIIELVKSEYSSKKDLCVQRIAPKKRTRIIVIE